MRNTMSLLVVAILSASCINLQGTLKVSEAFNAKKKGGLLNLQTKNVKIPAGEYSASIKINNSKTFNIKLKTENNEIVLPLKSEKDLSIPSNGHVGILGNQVGQPFDVSGNIETEVTYSERIRATETCFTQRYETRCDQFCSAGGINFPPSCQVVCHDVVVSYPGFQQVEYRNKFSQRNLKIDLLDSKNKNILASFEGSSSDSERIIDYLSGCY